MGSGLCPDSLKLLVQQFFQNLFQQEFNDNQPSQLPNGFLRLEDNYLQLLQRPFCQEEIKTALFDKAPLKSPRDDSFHASFYQNTWDITGTTLTRFVFDFLDSGMLPAGVNDTLLVLIPKVQHPELISQFRPINLCNVCYKVITKTLTNRLKGIMKDLVSPNQNSFVPGRQITDNVIIYQEVLHSMPKNKKGKDTMMIRIDLEKAYDRLSWSFIRDTYEIIGLPSS